MLAGMIRRYLQNEYALVDRSASAHAGDGFNQKHWDAFAELGLIAAFFTKENGGIGRAGFG